MSHNESENSFVPPEAMAKNAKEGLALREKFNRGGTSVGVRRAEQLKARAGLDPEDIKSIYSYFKRHEVDKHGKNFNNKDNPSAGYIAWQLWGGDEGFDWICKQREKI